jgi:mono/diheme cytochrome c family protein
MAKKWRLGSTLPVLAALAVIPASAQTSSSAPEALLMKYCFTCHSEKLHTAGLALDKMDFANVGAEAEVWEKVAAKLRTGSMPPPGLPRPDNASASAFVSKLTGALDRAAEAHPNPGRVPVHRLNQVEYANAVRDLLALDVDARSLLVADDVSKEGFDNTAGVLSASPALLERYMSAARKISRLAIGDPTIAAGFDVYNVPKLLVQDDRVSEDLPFGTRGGFAVHHRFPLDAEYVVKIRLRRQLYSYILGMGRPHQIEVRLDGKLIKLLTVGGEAKGRPAPASYSGNVAGDASWEYYMHFADDPLEVRFPARAGDHVVGVAFLEDVPEPEGVRQPFQVGFGAVVNELYGGNPAVENVAVGGPYKPEGPGDTPSRRKVFTCSPNGSADEEPCARKILEALARRAYRRPVSNTDVRTLGSFYDDARKHGSFEAGIQAAVERILSDPEFLFRVEPDPPSVPARTAYRLGDLELASRLSFFLWSSIPDDQLLELAARSKLSDPAVLQREVKRMLTDPRSEALVDNFATHWLKLPKLPSAAPLPQLFPEFDENLRSSFAQETRLFVLDQLRADRSVTDLLSADYTFVNERLARHYGVPDVYGSRFRKVTFSNGERGGLLGQGSILTVTSYANRTSPVIRGKWLLDAILGEAPPPPPADVPTLKETGDNGKPTTVRERVEQHRKDPACAGCHVRMDPLGFALENYDPIGKWRSTADGLPIDTSSTFPDGTRFTGVRGLRELLLNHREEFVETFTAKLLTYAIGRDMEYYDLPAIRKITREAAAHGYRWSSIVESIVQSAPFQMSTTKATARAESSNRRTAE